MSGYRPRLKYIATMRLTTGRSAGLSRVQTCRDINIGLILSAHHWYGGRVATWRGSDEQRWTGGRHHVEPLFGLSRQCAGRTRYTRVVDASLKIGLSAFCDDRPPASFLPVVFASLANSR
jgi:hypothetical protein